MKPDTQKEVPYRWNEVIIPIKEPSSHKHYFEFVEHGACKCRKCGFGLIGVVKLEDGLPV